MKRVVVGISGGVDSAVCALILKEKGFFVIGVTLKLFEDLNLDYAKRVANFLSIPHHIIDLERPFFEKVVKHFVSEYKCGRTPNPCIRCNELVKFEILKKKANEFDSIIATGHYARVTKEGKIFALKKGMDIQKDQSYFLYRLDQEILSKLVLPLGDMRKRDVKMIAENKKIPAISIESKEICFVGEKNYTQFLKMFLDTEPGPIYHIKTGEKIGEHKGIIFYTTGQRKGLGIASKKPLYVIKIDPKKNAIFVGEEKELLGKRVIVSNVKFTDGTFLEEPKEAKVKLRYRQKEKEAILYPKAVNKIELVFKEPQRAITPGQSAVFYDGDKVLGGGIIESWKRD